MKARTCGASQVVQLGTNWKTWPRITVSGKNHIKKENYLYSKQVGGKVYQNLLSSLGACLLPDLLLLLTLLAFFSFNLTAIVVSSNARSWMLDSFFIFSYASGVFGKWVFMWIYLWRCHLDGGWWGDIHNFCGSKNTFKFHVFYIFYRDSHFVSRKINEHLPLILTTLSHLP